MGVHKFQIQVSGITIEVTKKDIKNVHLRVSPPDGRVRLSSPRHVSVETLRQLVTSKTEWIKKNVQKFNSGAHKPQREFLPGETHYVQGKPCTLHIIEEDKPPKVRVRENQKEKYLDLYVRPGSDRAKREKILKEWYRGLLKEQLPALIAKWEKELGVSVKDWGVKQMKTRWGSCNIRACRIWLNLELAKKPKHLLDYVVLHEVAHLIERTHNKRFKKVLDTHMPDWRRKKDELNNFIC